MPTASQEPAAPQDTLRISAATGEAHFPATGPGSLSTYPRTDVKGRPTCLR